MRLQIRCVTGAGRLFRALRGALACGLLAGNFAGASTFTVTNTDDSGTGSLRQAIVSANGNGNPGVVDTIAFNIAGSGVHGILVTSGLLPDLVEPVFIDGLSQPGASCSSWPPTLQIEVRTDLHAFWTLNLVPGSDGSTIRGIVFNVGAGPVNSGIRITSDGNKVQCNFVGTNATGDASLPFGVGVDLTTGAERNVIGTDGDGVNDDRERNLVSGNSTWNLDIQGADANVIAGNYIGTNAAGTAPLGARVGVFMAGGAKNNRIGTNGDGVSDTLERNVISGNKLGVQISGGATGTTLAGNFIGTNAVGTSAVKNTGPGLDITGTTTVGGAGARANRIAFNGTWGIVVRAPSTSVNISSNSIHSNGDRGIDLGGDAVTANDPKDTDAGPNQLQNYPVLTGALLSGGTLSVSGALNSTPDTTFLVQVFANDACDTIIGGYGEGEIFLGSINVTTNGDGDATFSDTYTGVSAGQVITATARDPGLNTSEFSACFAVVTATETPTPTEEPAGLTLVEPEALPEESIHAIGTLGTGSYQLCIVPNDTFTPQTLFTGTKISCVNFDSPGGAFGSVVVWSGAERGAYDLLALDGSDRIVTGTDLGDRPGLTVGRLVGVRITTLAVVLLAAGLIRLARRSRSRG